MWLHSGDHHDLYFSHNFIRVIKIRRARWAGSVTCMGKRKGAYRVLVRKTCRKQTLGRPRRRWDDIKIVLKKQDKN